MQFQIAPGLDVGILYIFAIGSLSVYGVILAGYASNNKYSFLGGMRSSAQLISYEIPLGMSILGMVLLAQLERESAVASLHQPHPKPLVRRVAGECGQSRPGDHGGLTGEEGIVATEIQSQSTVPIPAPLSTRISARPAARGALLIARGPGPPAGAHRTTPPGRAGDPGGWGNGGWPRRPAIG